MIRETGAAQRAPVAASDPGHRGRPRRGRPRSAGSHVRRDRATSSTPAAGGRPRATSAAATPTTTSWSTFPTPTSCSPATCVENGAPPYFGDGYPLDWPATAEALRRARRRGAVVPGHGDRRRPRVRRALDRGVRAIAELATLGRTTGVNRRSTTRSRGRPTRRTRGARADRTGARPAARRARLRASARDAHHPAARAPRRRGSRRAPARGSSSVDLGDHRRRDPRGRRSVASRPHSVAARPRSACSPSPSRAAPRRAG